MVGGRYQPGWDTRAQAGIHDSWPCVRVDAQAGVEASTRALASAQSGGSFFGLRYDVWRVYRTSFRSHFSPHAKTLNSKTLFADSKQSPAPCLWPIEAMRDWQTRIAAFCPGQDASRSRMGIVRSSPQPHVQGVHRGKGMELPGGRKILLPGSCFPRTTRRGEEYPESGCRFRH